MKLLWFVPLSTLIAAEPVVKCSSLAAKSFGDEVKIRSAALVAAKGNLPEHCDIRGVIWPEAQFAIKLPTTWNDRFQMVGNGGTAGVITTVKDRDALLCAVTYAISGTTTQSNMIMTDTKSGTVASKPWAVNTTSTYTLAQTWNLGLAASCTISEGGVSAIAPITLALPNNEPPAVGVYAKSFAVQVQWVMLMSL